VPPVFTYLQRKGNVEQSEMDRTFNMGVGMVVVVEPARLDELEAHLGACEQESRRIGEVVVGAGEVDYV
jgi:phosphoribosylformylglycinamidine cyclo-ligase